MADTPDTRPSLDARDSNFNRIRLNPTTREDILSHIDDSSESLPLAYPSDDDESGAYSPAPSSKQTAPEAIPTTILSKSRSGGSDHSSGSGNKGAGTKRHSFFGRKSGSGLKQEMSATDIATPKAEIADPLAKKGALLSAHDAEAGARSPGADTTPTHSRKSSLAAPAGNGNGEGLSQVDTHEDVEGNGAGKDKRPGAMRRLTTRIKRTVSSNPK